MLQETIFLSCCFTGYANIDVYNLTSQNVITGVDGKKWITKTRKKSGNPAQIRVLPIAMEIIEKYKYHATSTERATDRFMVAMH